MEDSNRCFEAVKIGMASIETGRERITKDGSLGTTTPAYWRLNLTALSDMYNLYFVAICDQIHVYEPEFPFQKLGGRQKLTIVPQLANPRASGYISHSWPHNINNLIVGHLGEQEILLLSTDSGNIVGYETRSFITAIANLDGNIGTDAYPSDYVDIRPFFSQWVHESAWGLAIHTKARMIAVSANASTRNASMESGVWGPRGTITVFAFALTDEDSGEESSECRHSRNDSSTGDLEWHLWSNGFGVMPATGPDRCRNYKVVLSGSHGHPTNIPHVAFVNSHHDQSGCWLMSTDVNENIKLWHIWAESCLHTWSFKDPAFTGAAWMGGEERGWIAVTLDRQAFLPVPTTESLIGYRRAAQHYGYRSQGESFDVSHVARDHVPSNAWNHPRFGPDGDDSDSSSDDLSMQIMDDISDSGFSGHGDASMPIDGEVEESTISSTHESSGPQVLNSQPTVRESESPDASIVLESSSEESSDEEDQILIQSDFSEEDESADDQLNGSAASRGSDASISSYTSLGGSRHHARRQRSTISGAHGEDENGGDGVSARTTKSLIAQAAGLQRIMQSASALSNVPFLYCSSSHLRLFDNVNAKSPHFFCARLLRQSVSNAMEDRGIFQMDRLNMVEQIPELGLIIIASQVGRCAVCSLTKRNEDGVLGLRIDWVLPTGRQERAGHRPDAPLHGIAVSPIQGRQYHHRTTAEHAQNVKAWTRDRVVDGVYTVFDKDITELCGPDEHFSGNTNTSRAGPDKSTEQPEQDQDAPRVRPYEWSKNSEPENWRSVEGTRRYRLMMTYSDMTVLTYEIWRGAEREDIRST